MLGGWQLDPFVFIVGEQQVGWCRKLWVGETAAMHAGPTRTGTVRVNQLEADRDDT